MKQKTDYFCRGCAIEVTIFGIMSKDARVYCKNCKIEMYEVYLVKHKKTNPRALKSQKKVYKK